jgi:hypothetical protein
MALANLKSLGQRHIGLGCSVGLAHSQQGVISRCKSVNWSNSCLSGSRPGVYPLPWEVAENGAGKPE